MKEILELDWDPDKFVKNVGDGIGVLKEFEGQFEKVANQAKDVSFAKPISEITKLKSLIENSAKLEGLDLSKFNTSADEMVRSGPSITKFLNELKKNIKESTDPTEFEALKQIIGQTEGALKELTGEVGKNETKTKSAKARLREMKQELLALEDAGLDSTKMFKKLTLESAQLEDQIGDLSERVKVYASDTFKMDATVDVLQNVAGGWQLAEGAMALFGAEGEEVQKSMQKLLAIQNVANGLQQINAFLTGQSAGKLAILDGWNKLVAMSTSLVASSTATATASQRAYGVALASTGIGLLVISLGLLVANWDKVSRAMSGTTAEQESYNEAVKESSKTLTDAKVKINDVQSAFDSARKGTLSKEKALQIYNETLGQTYGEANNLEQAERIFVEKTPAYLQAVQKRAIAQLLFQKSAEKSVEAITMQEIDFWDKMLTMTSVYGIMSENSETAILERRKKQKQKEADDLTKLAQKSMDEARTLESKFGLEMEGVKDEKTKKEKKAIENVYKERLHDLQNQIQKQSDTELQGLDKINADYIQKTRDRFEAIEKDLTDGKLNKTEAEDLRRKANLLSANEYNAAVEDFRKQQLQKRTDLQNELNALVIANNHDNLERERLQVEENYRKRIDALKKLQSEAAKDQQQIIGLIIKEEEVKLQSELAEINRQALQQKYDAVVSNIDLIESEQEKHLAQESLKLLEQYGSGLINKRQYEDGIAKIEKEYQAARLDSKISGYNKEIEALTNQLALETEIIKIEGIQKQINEIEKAKAEAIKSSKKDISTGDSIFAKIFGLDPSSKEFSQKKQQILDGFKSLVNSTISIIKEQSRAEVEAYDIAIGLQKQRVDEAQKLAEAGNAEYLQMERERLLELEQKREESARRQLEIDAALQTSQILVAIAGAAAQIAQGGVGNVIAGIATIGAAVASGFVLLNQLSASRPKFYHGTEGLGVKDNAKPTFSTGQDDYLIQAHRNERIVPDYINSKLGNIKNSELPDIVQKAKLYEASLMSQSMQTQTYSVPKIEKENNDLRKEIQELKKESEKQTKILEKFGVVIKLDEDGLAVSMQKSIEAKEKMKRA